MLGLSGGLDSCVLLDLLLAAQTQLDFRLSALHVHHGISPNADAWADFCAELCSQHKLALNIVRVNVPRDNGLGLEAAAREARYQAMMQQDADVVVLAHHQDDQAETLLLQLLRGSGVEGLAAMPIHGNWLQKPILRPLLEVPRSALETYAQENRLVWINDESNLDTRFDRNFLRHQVFPAIAPRFSAYRTTLSRAAENLADAANFLTQIAVEDAATAVRENRLDIGLMKRLTPERAMNLLRWWIRAETGFNPSRAWLLNVLDQLLHAQPNAQVACCLGRVVVRRYREWACIDRSGDAHAYRVDWRGEAVLNFPDGGQLNFEQVSGAGVAADKITQGLVVTNRSGAEARWKLSLRLDEKRPTRSLKNLWQEAGIPPWEREHQPLVWHQGVLVAVGGVGIDCQWQAGAGEAGVLLRWKN